MAATKRNAGLTSAVPRATLNDEELVIWYISHIITNCEITKKKRFSYFIQNFSKIGIFSLFVFFPKQSHLFSIILQHYHPCGIISLHICVCVYISWKYFRKCMSTKKLYKPWYTLFHLQHHTISFYGQPLLPLTAMNVKVYSGELLDKV